MPITDEQRKAEYEHNRQQMLQESETHRRFVKEVLQPIKDKLDLFGERALTAKERVIVDQRRAFFFPGEG